MDSDIEVPPSILRTHPQLPPLGRHSLPPTNACGSHENLPSYPSSYVVVQSTHIDTYSSAVPPDSQAYVLDNPYSYQMPLPSASQSHIPSLRHTPSVPHDVNIDNQHLLPSPFLDQQLYTCSCISDCIHSLSPINFIQPQSAPTAFPHNQPTHTFAPPQLVPTLAAPQPTHPVFPPPLFQHNHPVPPNNQQFFLHTQPLHTIPPFPTHKFPLLLLLNLLQKMYPFFLTNMIGAPGIWWFALSS